MKKIIMGLLAGGKLAVSTGNSGAFSINLDSQILPDNSEYICRQCVQNWGTASPICGPVNYMIDYGNEWEIKFIVRNIPADLGPNAWLFLLASNDKTDTPSFYSNISEEQFYLNFNELMIISEAELKLASFREENINSLEIGESSAQVKCDPLVKINLRLDPSIIRRRALQYQNVIYFQAAIINKDNLESGNFENTFVFSPVKSYYFILSEQCDLNNALDCSQFDQAECNRYSDLCMWAQTDSGGKSTYRCVPRNTSNSSSGSGKQ